MGSIKTSRVEREALTRPYKTLEKSVQSPEEEIGEVIIKEAVSKFYF